MTSEELLALAGFALAASWTPGPNNAMLAASGANWGLRRTLPHILGVVLGFALMVFLVAIGFAGVFRAFPVLTEVLRWTGAAFLLWMAWRIATAAGVAGAASGRPMSFLEAAAFQWVNPKGWLMCMGVLAQFAGGPDAALRAALVALVFILAGAGSSIGWALFGAGIGRLLGSPARLRLFNGAMGGVLALSVLWMLAA